MGCPTVVYYPGHFRVLSILTIGSSALQRATNRCTPEALTDETQSDNKVQPRIRFSVHNVTWRIPPLDPQPASKDQVMPSLVLRAG